MATKSNENKVLEIIHEASRVGSKRIRNVRGLYYTDHDIVSTSREILEKFIRELHRVATYVKILCQILDIGYEYGFVSLSSSKRDGEDNLSEADRREAVLLKQNEALSLQADIAAWETMKTIDSLFGPFNGKEIEFHRNALKNDVGNFQNPFQKQLIHDLFYKYFGDTEVIHHVKEPSVDYIKMMLSARKLLEDSKMVIMPYVISGKVEKLVPRKTINKKEEKEMMANPLYPLLEQKYGNNKKVMEQILSMFATVISSTFRIIDYRNPSLHGKMFDTNPAIVMHELLVTALLF